MKKLEGNDMKIIISNKNFNLEEKSLDNPVIRFGARGIVINKEGKIAVIYKKNKNEYKLPGGGVENDENFKQAFEREVLEETGCKVIITRKLGITEEYRSDDNFKQISHIFIAKVVKDIKKLDLTTKESDEGSSVIWMYKEEAFEKINDCINMLNESEYENLYHSKFIVKRDSMILEYFIKGKYYGC